MQVFPKSKKRKPSDRMLASSAEGSRFNPQSRSHHTKDDKKMVPIVTLFSTQLEKVNTGSFSNSIIPSLRALWNTDLNVK